MLKKWYLCAAMVAMLCFLVFGSRQSSADQTTTTAKPSTPSTRTTKATFDFKRYTGNKPFRLNTLQTTPYGPAWADIIVQSSNFLECRGAAIALCYYSGPGPATPWSSVFPAMEILYFWINACLGRRKAKTTPSRIIARQSTWPMVKGPRTVPS